MSTYLQNSTVETRKKEIMSIEFEKENSIIENKGAEELPEYLEEMISKAKRNRFFAEGYSSAVEERILEIEKTYGEKITAKLLNSIYRNLNTKIKRERKRRRYSF